MKVYQLTVFDPTGGKLLDESFEAANDQEAKMKGTAILSEKEWLEKTHRCASPEGKLILFHR